MGSNGREEHGDDEEQRAQGDGDCLCIFLIIVSFSRREGEENASKSV
jgi:hypothetical protein